MNRHYKNVLVVTDNGVQYDRFKELISNDIYSDCSFTFRKSKSKYSSKKGKEKLYNQGVNVLDGVDVKLDWHSIIEKYDLVISLHCKQLFPVELITRVKCINIHPGYNPYNRGWYPQVFAINQNTDIIGATIHEIDEKLDHGKIIARDKVEILPWDTSKEVYERVLDLEIVLLEKYLPKILNNDYSLFQPEIEGKLYLKKDFNNLCEIDLNEEGTFSDFVNRLRALSHGKYKNAYFITNNNEKVFISVSLEKE